MKSFLIITHIKYRNNRPAAGPYSTVVQTLKDLGYETTTVGLPLDGYNQPVTVESDKEKKTYNIPKVLGMLLPIKYLIDILVVFYLIAKYKNYGSTKSSIIGIDPLSTFPAVFLKKVFGYKLLFYSVDFNTHRFKNEWLQKIYEWMDEFVSTSSDQVWNVGHELKKYKKDVYNLDTYYVPNSFPFTRELYDQNKSTKNGNKTIWTGSILTDKQVADIIDLCKAIQNIRPEMEFWFVPINKIDLFSKLINEKSLENSQIFDVEGQEASRKLVAQCDLGLAIYNKDFGSTDFVEPIKIWEYMLCGMPFIISGEIKLNSDIKNSGVALRLGKDNLIPNQEILEKFVNKENLLRHRETALKLSEKYDTKKTMGDAINDLK